GPDDRARSEWVMRQLGGRDSALAKALGERFMLRFFRFAGGADRVAAASDLHFAGQQTHLADALDFARQELASVPLSGLVVVTDGADNAPAAGGALINQGPTGAGRSQLSETLLSLQARGVPVFTVGLGRDATPKDIEVSRVQLPRSALKGTSLVVDLMVTQSGYKGATVPLVVEDGGRIVATQQVQLPNDGEPAPVRVHVTVTEGGPRRFKFRIPAQPGELVPQNNEREALVVVRDRKEKVLYVEGEPRYEMKFMRRAVAEDENLQLVVLQRTAENKFLRLGVDDSLEVVGGFPKTREELFAYRGLVIGSVEASFFTHDQLRMIADFVGERGGGLLLLGGRSAFAEGGYAGTPVADVMPVEVGPRDAADTSYFTELRAEPTPAGLTHPATQIAAGEKESAARWRTLPPVSSVNHLGRLKPGATVLLGGVPTAPETPLGGSALSNSGGAQPVLVYQRYGRGLSIAMPIQDSWLWQMHADVPLEDMTHETFWRQTLRWLVSEVPGRLTASAADDQVAPNEPVALRASVEDAGYLKLNDARVSARVTGPTGAISTLPMEWSVERDGEYRASFAPAEAGVYEVAMEATRDGKPAGADTAYLEVSPPRDEYFDARMRAPLLRRIAQETGGRFYTPADVASLPEDIRFTAAGGATTVEQMDLWDMPALFLLLVALVAGEWGYRRWRGMV
ncbi:MAG TPA: hypothetical protein VKA84_28435, partial [Gemmatimonadaceae bacterium]|nr:hypothetical protein [Gemmatimonadaceae bacterium]